MSQENQPSASNRDRLENTELTSTTCNIGLSETECDRKAMLFWCGAGKPERQYPIYRKAIEQWVKAGAVEGDFNFYLKELRLLERRSLENENEAISFWYEDGKPEGQYEVYLEAVEWWKKAGAIKGEFKVYLRRSQKNVLARLPKTWVWPWITALIIPILAVGVVLAEIQASQNALNNTIKVQREQDRLHILKDYMVHMTNLIGNRDLVSKYPRDKNGKYNPHAIPHPDALIATSLTNIVAQLLDKEDKGDPKGSGERGALIIFLNDCLLLEKENPVINLEGIRLHRANLRGAKLQRISLRGAILGKAKFNYATLSDADLENAFLEGANLAVSDFRRANLNMADLSRTNLFSTNFEGASLKGADLSDSSMKNTFLQGVDFEGAILRGAHFEGANGLTLEQKADFIARGAIVD